MIFSAAIHDRRMIFFGEDYLYQWVSSIWLIWFVSLSVRLENTYLWEYNKRFRDFIFSSFNKHIFHIIFLSASLLLVILVCVLSVHFHKNCFHFKNKTWFLVLNHFDVFYTSFPKENIDINQSRLFISPFTGFNCETVFVKSLKPVFTFDNLSQ